MKVLFLLLSTVLLLGCSNPTGPEDHVPSGDDFFDGLPGIPEFEDPPPQFSSLYPGWPQDDPLGTGIPTYIGQSAGNEAGLTSDGYTGEPYYRFSLSGGDRSGLPAWGASGPVPMNRIEKVVGVSGLTGSSQNGIPYSSLVSGDEFVFWSLAVDSGNVPDAVRDRLWVGVLEWTPSHDFYGRIMPVLEITNGATSETVTIGNGGANMRPVAVGERVGVEITYNGAEGRGNAVSFAKAGVPIYFLYSPVLSEMGASDTAPAIDLFDAVPGDITVELTQIVSGLTAYYTDVSTYVPADTYTFDASAMYSAFDNPSTTLAINDGAASNDFGYDNTEHQFFSLAATRDASDKWTYKPARAYGIAFDDEGIDGNGDPIRRPQSIFYAQQRDADGDVQFTSVFHVTSDPDWDVNDATRTLERRLSTAVFSDTEDLLFAFSRGYDATQLNY